MPGEAAHHFPNATARPSIWCWCEARARGGGRLRLLGPSDHGQPMPEGTEGLRGPWGAPMDEAKHVSHVDGPIPGWNQW